MGELIVVLVLIALGYTSGRIVERRHLARLALREEELADIAVSEIRHLPPNWQVDDSFLVTGTCVIATDYFKVFVGGLRNLFGGRIRSFETLMQRARREAVVRMLDEARSHSANAVWNVRIETATIQGKGKPGGAEVIAYGTALVVR